MANVRITQLDETTTLTGNEVVVDSPNATELYKVDLGTIVSVAKNAAETTDATVASASGLTAEVVPVGDPPEYNYVPDEGTNYLKTADFAAAALTANLKNADKILDDAIANINVINGTRRDASVIAGEIDITGNFNFFNITATDASDVADIIFDAGVYKIAVFTNASGSPIKFVSGSNIIINGSAGEQFYLRDEETCLIILKSTTATPFLGNNIQPITFDNLDTMLTNSSLIEGKLYLIEDFETIYDQPDYDAAGTVKAAGLLTTKTATTEPLVVLATSASTISSHAWSTTYPQDEILYDPTFTATEVKGTAAKGRITYRKDDVNNVTHYDHRAVVFKRYESSTGSGVYNSYKDNGEASAEFPTFNPLKNIGNNYIPLAVASHTFLTTNNVFKGNCYGNYADVYFANNTAEDGAMGFLNNQIQSSCINNTLGHTFRNNKIGASFQDNVIGNVFRENNIQDAFQYNTIGDTCTGNNFQAYFRYNTVGDNFERNDIGELSTGNTIGNNFQENRCSPFGIASCTIADDFQMNILGTNVSGVDFTLSTHVYGAYTCNIYVDKTDGIKLSYVDSGTVTIADIDD